MLVSLDFCVLLASGQVEVEQQQVLMRLTAPLRPRPQLFNNLLKVSSGIVLIVVLQVSDTVALWQVHD